jgi:hypothetical protein
VVIVPFPFVDTPVAKPRPALVLSDAGFNCANEHSVLAMITRATHTRWPSDHLITDQEVWDSNSYRRARYLAGITHSQKRSM